MKKLIVAAAAIALAVASQAAVVDWGYKITGDKTVANATEAAASDYAKNYVAYLFAADAAVSDWSHLTQDDLALAKDSAAVKYQSYASRTGASYATANSQGVVGNVRTLDVGDATSYAARIVVVDTVNNSYYANDAMTIASRAETAGAGTAGVKSVAQATFAGQTFTPLGAAPEPTSGLLLLVGGAMLALRRKQK